MFHGPGDSGTVRLTYTVTGNFESVGPSFFRAGGQLGLAGANAEFGWSWLNELSQPQAAFFGHAHVVDLDNDPGGLRATIALSQTVETGVWYDIFSSLWLELSASRIDTALSQFGHTARLAIELPDGWTMTSRSGAFMTDVDDPAGAVPEPASALLALLALAAATATRTRRQR
jgi:MYXO-CTERM domain-containing protein